MIPVARYTDMALYRRLMQEARGFGGHLLVILLLSLLAAPLALLLPVPLMLVVDHVIDDQPMRGVMQAVLPGWATASPQALLVVAALMLVAVMVLQQAEGFASWLLQLYTGEKLSIRFRAKLFLHLQRLSLLYHDRRGTADSLYRIQYDAPGVQYLLISGLVPLITSLVMLAAMILVIARINLPLAGVALGVAPVVLVLTEWYRRRMRPRWTRVKEQDSLALGVVSEVLSSVRVVKAFVQEARESERFVKQSGRSLRAQLGAVLVEAAFGVSIAFFLAAGSAAVLYLGTVYVRSGRLTLGELLLVVAYLAQLYKPLETISRKAASLQSSMAGAERVYSLLDESPDVAEKAGARPLGKAGGHFVFQGVSFGYVAHGCEIRAGDSSEGGECRGESSQPVLRDVWLEIPPGARVGIMGCTGAGKTTLVNLLNRFYDPTAGRILLDGTDLRDYRLSDLRRQFAIVLQEPVLFSTSIAENIAYGRADATMDQVIAAARAAHAHDFISALPQGYQTPVGERGMSLSGGERQRIALARAFLKDAAVLILDEPTSSVDGDSEAMILQAMRRLMQGRTTFMIAHRRNTLEVCDRLVRLENGRVVPCEDRLRARSVSDGSGAEETPLPQGRGSE